MVVVFRQKGSALTAAKANYDLNMGETNNQRTGGEWPNPPNGGEAPLGTLPVAGNAAVPCSTPLSGGFTALEKEFLLELARRTMTCVAINGDLPIIREQDVPAKSMVDRACFVTLKKAGSLRGCVGHVEPQEPLFQAVIHNTRNACRRDPRFSPVQADEVNLIRIEISVLTELQPLHFSSPEDLLNRLQAHEHGVLLQCRDRSATFLPKVWAQFPDTVEFLNQLCEKAGCEPAAWRGGRISVFTYQVEAFEEPQ